jgi:hypothetical protein
MVLTHHSLAIYAQGAAKVEQKNDSGSIIYTKLLRASHLWTFLKTKHDIEKQYRSIPHFSKENHALK